MKIKTLTTCFLFALALSSCIRDEALNSEADILSCTIGGDILNREPIIDNDEITLLIKDGAEISNVIPKFTLTEGATISPEEGSSCDFTKSQTYIYTVTSQDKKWNKEYILKALPEINSDYSFENIRLKSSYYTFYEKFDNGNEILSWASGNEGFAFTGVKASPEEFPTTKDDNGYKGKCLKLQTKSTGNLGESMGMPLAAGNLFLGNFQINLSDVLSATKFGVPFMHIPTKMEGWYKYQPGPIFYKLNSNKKLEEDPTQTDQCNFYAVFYEGTSNSELLTGHNILDLSNPSIISIARSKSDIPATNSWTQFTFEFETLPNRKVEETKLKEGRYNLAVVFSSSIKGDHFEGALESTLWIDEVSINYEGKEK
ncbi:MAG TPA: PCMD domain-containing protein [Bacteroides reticulotermitis]|nr:PCMD domain-containing protein [Bacteroides reticulotermitis]